VKTIGNCRELNIGVGCILVQRVMLTRVPEALVKEAKRRNYKSKKILPPVLFIREILVNKS